MHFMFKWVLRVDQDIINVGGVEVINIVKQDQVDEALKGGRSITEAEGHNSVLVGAIARAEGGKVFNVFLKSDAVKGVVDIKLGEDAGLG